MATEEDHDTEMGESSDEYEERRSGSGDAVESEPWTTDSGAELPADFQQLVEELQDNATARAVFGEPIERSGRTVLPMARVGFGFGGGSGTEPGADGEQGGGGKGMGGGLMARPVGALEVTDTDTRFVGVGGRRRTAVTAIVAFLAGWLLARALGGSGDD